MTGTAESTAGSTAAAETGTPRLVRTAAELRALSGPYGTDDGSWKRATVMTMGALHAGHAALIRAARERLGPRGQVVVTVFVNPLQFGPSEDLDRYPRTLDADLLVARDAGADVVFAPSADEVYPGGEPHVRIAAGAMGERFEGAYRHGHFDGVLTVVAKLLHLTAPDFACFGQKDAQQLAMIRRMVRDLNFPVEIIGVPTVREPDGLALSSRNRYLSPDGRECALALSRGLFAARDAARYGPDAALAAARDVLDAAAHREPSFTVDYLALIDPAEFTELTGRTEGDGAGNGTGTAAEPADAVLAVAARVGGTRLIDNVLLSLGAPR